MKRFSLRKSLFLCAPVAVVAAVFVGIRILNPPRDPNSIIALSVTSAPNPPSKLKSAFNFQWKAVAQGGPQNHIQLLYTQQLVALGTDNSRSRVIFQKPDSLTTTNIQIIHDGEQNESDNAFQEIGQNIGIPSN